MKQISSLIIFCLAFIVCLPLNSSLAQGIRGSKNVIEQDRSLSGFQEIYVEDGIDVHIKQGTADAVIVKADDNLVDYIKTKIENGKLMIYSDRVSIRNSKSYDVYVTVKELNVIKAKSGSDVYGLSTIETDELSIELRSGSDLKMEVHAARLNCEITGGSDAKISGKVDELIAHAKGGSDLMAKKLIAQYLCKSLSKI